MFRGLRGPVVCRTRPNSPFPCLSQTTRVSCQRNPTTTTLSRSSSRLSRSILPRRSFATGPKGSIDLPISIASKLAGTANIYNDRLRSPEVRNELQAYDREMSSGKRSPDLMHTKRFISVFGHLDGMLPVVLAHWRQAAERGLQPDMELQVLLMRVCSRCGDIEKANEVWQAILRSGVTPPAKAFAVIIDAFGRNGDVRKAQQAFDLLQRRGVQPDYIVYTVLMSCYARVDSTEAVDEIWNAMRADGIVPVPQMFVTLISIAVQRKNTALISLLLHNAAQMGLQLPVATIKSIEELTGKPLKESEQYTKTSLGTLIAHGAVRPAVDLIRSRRERRKLPTRSEVMNLLKVAYEQQLWMEAEWLVRFVAAEKLLPLDEESFRHIVLEPWLKRGDLALVVLLTRAWLPLSPSASTNTLLELLQIAARAHSLREVYSCFSPSMIASFDRQSLTSLCSLLARNGLMKEVDALLTKAVTEKRKVEADAVSILMKEAVKERDAASLERWMRVLVELGHSPPQEAVELLLQLLSKNPSSEPMEATIQWLKSISWTSSPDAFAVLMHHHLRRRDAEGAQATYEQGLRAGVRPRNAIVETLVETLALSGRVAEAERHFWQLQPRNPNPQLICVLLQSFADAGMIESAERLWRRFGALVSRDFAAYAALITMYANANQFEKASELAAEFEAVRKKGELNDTTAASQEENGKSDEIDQLRPLPSPI